MEDETGGEVPFEELLPAQRLSAVRRTLDTIQARLDNARLLGVNVEERGGDSKFRLEDEVNKAEEILLYGRIRHLEAELYNMRQKKSVPLKEASVFDFRSKDKYTKILLALENDEISKMALGSDIDIATRFGENKIKLKIIHHDLESNFSLKVDFPKDFDIDALTYTSSDLANSMNNEEYMIISYVVDKAFQDIIAVKQN